MIKATVPLGKCVVRQTAKAWMAGSLVAQKRARPTPQTHSVLGRFSSVWRVASAKRVVVRGVPANSDSQKSSADAVTALHRRVMTGCLIHTSPRMGRLPLPPWRHSSRHRSRSRLGTARGDCCRIPVDTSYSPRPECRSDRCWHQTLLEGSTAAAAALMGSPMEAGIPKQERWTHRRLDWLCSRH